MAKNYAYTDSYLDNYTPLGKNNRQVPGTVRTRYGVVPSVSRAFIDTFSVEEVIFATVTPEADSPPSNLLTGVLGYFKKPKETPPRILAFRIMNRDTPNVSWRPLPYYKFATTLELAVTNSFFVEEYAKIFVYQDRVEVSGMTTDAGDQEFIVFVLKERINAT